MTSCIKQYKYLPRENYTLAEIRLILGYNSNSIVFNAALTKDVDEHVVIMDEPRQILEPQILMVASTEILDPVEELETVAVEPVTLEPATLEPATLEPATLEPATLEPATLEPVTLQNETVIQAPIELPPIIIDKQEPVSTSYVIVKAPFYTPPTSVVQLKKFERFRIKNPPRF